MRASPAIWTFLVCASLCAASGSAAPGNPPVAISGTLTWARSEAGLQGTETVVFAGSDFRDTQQMGPFVSSYGRFKGQTWHRNENGLTVLTTQPSHDDRLTAASLSDVSATLDRPVIHRELAFPDRRISIDYDEYALTGGRLLPRHIHAADSLGSANDVDLRLTDFSDAPPPAGAVSIETNARRFDRFPPGVTRVRLSARFSGPRVIVRVALGDQNLDFQLDSGASGIVIDRGLVTRLGLTTYGNFVGMSARAYPASLTIVPEMAIGTIRSRDVVAEVAPVGFAADGSTEVVGLLGFDFIADAVIHVDYKNEMVEAIEPSSFDASAIARSIEVPIGLDSGIPIASALVDGSGGSRFVVDTGAFGVVVSPKFARAHGLSEIPQGATLSSIEQPARVVGGAVTLAKLHFSSFGFRGATFSNLEGYRLNDVPLFNDEIDGLIGYSYLKNFELYFDYANGRLILVR